MVLATGRCRVRPSRVTEFGAYALYAGPRAMSGMYSKARFPGVAPQPARQRAIVTARSMEVRRFTTPPLSLECGLRRSLAGSATRDAHQNSCRAAAKPGQT